ncbi:DUF2971 domain-containing protein [Nocardia sp. NPDC004860]|uniref:DUF2971 domain-containing protein n=1 Tax=Nocardia sp. NPDC004860 TaxID=3154557 RepID=UPI0033B166F9
MPDSLYHYTTAAGLLGILEPVPNTEDLGLAIDTTSERSFSLWATDARYLNDSAELTHAADKLAGAIINELQHVDDGDRKERLRQLAEQIRKGDFTEDDGQVTRLTHTAYVACFCTDGDLLSQWRGYGANGGGYSVEFDSKVLRDILVPALRAGSTTVGYQIGTNLVKVNYDLDDQELRAAAKQIVESDPGWELSRAVGVLAQFKHDAFSEEDEWRLIHPAGDFYAPLQFRPGPNGIVPFIKLIRPQPFDSRVFVPSAIKSVTVGPGPDQSLREEAVRQLLAQRGFFDTEVKPSRATYKG